MSAGIAEAQQPTLQEHPRKRILRTRQLISLPRQGPLDVRCDGLSGYPKFTPRD